MSIDIGDTVTIELTSVDTAGDPTDPTSVSVLVTAPDGTTSTPTPNNPVVGTYTATVVADQAGRWRWDWTAVGPANSEHGYFTVDLDPPDRLDTLATIADLEFRLGRSLTADEAARAPALLVDASAEIRSYCRPHKFTPPVVGDSVVLRPTGTTLILPGKPVTGITSVAAINRTNGGADVALSDWVFDGIDRVYLDRAVTDPSVDVIGWWDQIDRHTNTYRVVYDHGGPVDPLVVKKACQMVNRVLAAGTQAEGVTQETIGQFSRQWQQGTGSTGAAVVLSKMDKLDLAEAGYRRRSGTTMVHAR